MFQVFFDRADQKQLQEYLANGQEILKQLAPANQKLLKGSMDTQEKRWKVRNIKSVLIACCHVHVFFS